MSSPARLPLPAKVGGELWLAPDRRCASIDADRLHLFTAGQRDEHGGNGVEVFRHRAPLNDRVRLLDLVEVVGAVEKDRTGVDARIDAQQRHAYALEIAPCERPETAV